MLNIVQKSMTLNSFCKLLMRLTKGSNYSILINIQNVSYSPYMLAGDIRQVYVDDIAYADHTATLYCEFNRNTELMGVIDMDSSEDINVYDMFCLFHNSFDRNRNIFMPSVVVYGGNMVKDYCYSGRIFDDFLKIKEPEKRIITNMQIEGTSNPTSTCLIKLWT